MPRKRLNDNPLLVYAYRVPTSLAYSPLNTLLAV